MASSYSSSSSSYEAAQRRRNVKHEESEFIDQLASPVVLGGGNGGGDSRTSPTKDDEAGDLAKSSFQNLVAAASTARSVPVAKLLITVSDGETIWADESCNASVSISQKNPLTYKIRLKVHENMDLLARPRVVQVFSGDYRKQKWTILHMMDTEVGNNDNVQVTLWILQEYATESLLPPSERKAIERLSGKQVDALQQQFELAQVRHVHDDEVSATEIEDDEDDESLRKASRSDEVQASSVPRSPAARTNIATDAIEISDEEDVKPRVAKRTPADDVVSAGLESYPWLPQRTGFQEIPSRKGSSRKKKSASKAKAKSPSPTGTGPMDKHCTIDLTADEEGSKRKKRKQENEEHTHEIYDKTGSLLWSSGRGSRVPTADEMEAEQPIAKRSPIPAPVSKVTEVLRKSLEYGVNFAQNIMHSLSSGKENIVTSLAGDEEGKISDDDDLAIPASALMKRYRPDSILTSAGMPHLGAGIPSSTMMKRYDHPIAESPESAEAVWSNNPSGGAWSSSKYFTRSTKVVELLDDEEGQRRQEAGKESREPEIDRKQLDKVLFTFPEGSQDSVSITLRDVQKLSQDAFLNDSLIDFYLKHAVSMDVAVKQDRVHVFTSFLYTRMLDGLKSVKGAIDLDQMDQFASVWYRAYSQVRRWTVGEDLFAKSCIIFPINSGFHWSFAACCFENRDTKESPPRGRILTFDSAAVSSHDPVRIAELIRIYLNHEFESRIKLKMEPKPRNIKRDDAKREEEEDDDDFVPEILDNVQHLAGDKEHDPMAFTLNTVHFDESTVPVWKVPVPQQLDGVNCGVHLLNNAKRLIHLVSMYENGIESLDQFVLLVQNTFVGLDFRTEDANLMRETLKKEIKDIAEQAELARDAVRGRKV